MNYKLRVIRGFFTAKFAKKTQSTQRTTEPCVLCENPLRPLRLTFLTFFLLMISIFTNAQSVSYGYDASGNRISRTIVMPMNAPPPQDSTETIIEEEDLIAGNEKTQEVYTDTLADTQIAIYPNPTKGLLTIEMSDMRLSDMGLSDMRYETCDIAIYDMMRKCVWSSYGLTVLRHYSLQINISHLPAGTYIMRIAIEDEVVNWKIIKQ